MRLGPTAPAEVSDPEGLSMRIGLVGVGRIGAFHAGTLKGLDSVEKVVVTDVDNLRAQSLATELGLEAVADVETLLGAGLDGVAICAPTSAARRADRACPGRGPHDVLREAGRL